MCARPTPGGGGTFLTQGTCQFEREEEGSDLLQAEKERKVSAAVTVERQLMLSENTSGEGTHQKKSFNSDARGEVEVRRRDEHNNRTEANRDQRGVLNPASGGNRFQKRKWETTHASGKEQAVGAQQRSFVWSEERALLTVRHKHQHSTLDHNTHCNRKVILAAENRARRDESTRGGGRETRLGKREGEQQKHPENWSPRRGLDFRSGAGQDTRRGEGIEGGGDRSAPNYRKRRVVLQARCQSLAGDWETKGKKNAHELSLGKNPNEG